MCAHLFGATSALCGSNYALRKAAFNKINCYGNYAAEAIMKKFYVHDLLKQLKM